MNEHFRKFALKSSKLAASPHFFILLFSLVLLWLLLGPFFGWSDSYQLYMNTSTTIITVLMSALIQYTSDRSDRATHIKLDELLRTKKEARNRIMGLETARDDELDEAQAELKKLGEEEG